MMSAGQAARALDDDDENIDFEDDAAFGGGGDGEDGAGAGGAEAGAGAGAGDAEAGGAAAMVVVGDDGNVEPAALLDMPLGLHPSVKSVWAAIKAYPKLRTIDCEGFLYLETIKASQLRTIAYSLDIKQMEDGVYVVCRLYGCGHLTKVTNPDGSLNATNATRHYIRCGGMLTLEWAQQRGTAASAPSGLLKKRGAASPATKAAEAAAIAIGGAGGARAVVVDPGRAASAWAKGLALGLLPANLVANIGLKFIFSALQLPPMPARSTIRDHQQREYKKLCEINVAKIAAVRNDSSLKVTFMGTRVRLRNLFAMLDDNWTAKSGGSFMGLGVSYPQVTTAVSLGAPEGKLTVVRPANLMLAYEAFSNPAGDEDHDASYYRIKKATLLFDSSLEPNDMHASAADTTGVNRSSLKDGFDHIAVKDVVRIVDFRRVSFIPCGEHESNLVSFHAARIEPMASVIDAANKLSVFLSASDKRIAPLEQVQREAKPPITKPKKPLMRCPTRFFFSLAQAKALIGLDVPLAALNTRWETAHVSWFESWSIVYSRWASLRNDASKIISLFTPLLDDYVRMGNENEYTLSTRSFLFNKWNNHLVAAIKNPTFATVHGVAKEAQKQLWLRHAPLAVIQVDAGSPPDKKLGPADGVALTALERREKLDLDALANAAAYCDPAMWPHFRALGGVRPDARAHLWGLFRRMMRDFDYGAAGAEAAAAEAAAAAAAAAAPTAAVGGAGGGGAAPVAANGAGAGGAVAPAAALALLPPWQRPACRTKAAISAAVKARPKEAFENPLEFAAESERLIKAELERRARHGGGGAAADAPEVDEDAWLEALEKEFVRQCEEVYEPMWTSSTSAGILSKYGDPLRLPSKDERYAFWPKMKEQAPLLYFPAVVALCTPWTPMKLERVNSLAGIIMNRLRSNMKRETLSMLVLTREWLKTMLATVEEPHDLMDLGAWEESFGAVDDAPATDE